MDVLCCKVSLAVKWLPQLESSNFECVLRYQSQEFKFSATRESASTVSCDHFENLPEIPNGAGELVVVSHTIMLCCVLGIAQCLYVFCNGIFQLCADMKYQFDTKYFW